MGQPAFADVAERLFADFEGRMQLPEIVRAVTDAFRDLAASVAEPSLPEMVERLARHRLEQRLDGDPPHSK